jgi:Carboxypeptidase regulatory-like domain/TonB dependent receptor
MRLAKATTLLVLLFVVAADRVHAQTASGEVNGTVTDKSGGAVAAASVILINQGTQIHDQATTNANGYFVFINVKPGTYVLQIEAQGFKKAQVSPFDVGVNQTVSQTVKLEVGAVAQTVNVTAEAVMLERSTSELGTVIEQRTVSDLPLNGRNFTQLLTLTPGVTPVSTSQNKSIGCCEGNVGIPGSGFSDASFHGQENRSKLYFFDGIINTNVRGPTYIVIPNIDLIQEFKVVGHDAKAEFGGATGGVVDMVSTSGTGSFHGSAFEYVRNDAFDARNGVTDFDPVTGAPKIFPFRQNQFGATFSGPIIKNRTFFSGGYDGWRYTKPTLDRSYVPTAAEISGDFTKQPEFASGVHQLYNPYSGSGAARTPFVCDARTGAPINTLNANRVQVAAPGQPTAPCNKLPQALISPEMQGLFLKYAAQPNYSVATDPGHNFIQTRPTPNNSNAFQVRIDHRLSQKDNLFFRYTEERVSVLNPIGEVGFTGGGSTGRNYGGGWVHTFRPNLIMDLRVGYAGRPSVDAGQQNQHPLGLDPLKQLGFKDIDKFAGILVRLTTTEWIAGGSNDFGVRGPAPRENPNWSITPNIAWIKGSHNLKTGFWFIDTKRIQENTFQRFTFGDGQTGLANSSSTGLSLASALLGLPSSVGGELPVSGSGPVKYKYATWAAYVQDEWKIRPKLTLNLGLRYDYLTQPETLDSRLWNALDLSKQQWIIGAVNMPPLCSVAQKAPCIPDGAPLFTPATTPACNNTTIPCDFTKDPHFSNVVVAGKRFFSPPAVKDNWGPRIGVAWQITPKTVLRGGYGLYWDTLAGRGQGAQNVLEKAVWPDALALNGDFNGNNLAPSQQKTIDQIQGNFAGSLPAPTPWTSGSFFVAPNYKDPYSQQWNVEVQREITPNLMFSAAYVGSKNGRLDYEGNANAATHASPNNTCARTDTACNNAYIAAIDGLRTMPWANSGIVYAQSIGYSNYNALEAKVQRRFANGLNSLLSYTFGKSIDTSSGFFNAENGPQGGSSVQNYFDLNSARGVSAYDITHFVSWATVYELPAGRGKKWLQSGPLSWVLGNWQANYIFQARSGQPYGLTVAGDVANIKGSGGIGSNGPTDYARPNIISDPFVAGPVAANPNARCQKTISQGGLAADAVHTVQTWFNPCAFAIPSGSFGNLGKNPFRGPAVFNMDFSMFKSVPLPKEGMFLQLRFEAFNVFNIQNFDAPGVPSGSANAVRVGNASLGIITGLAVPPRQLQFGLRLTF